MRLIFIFALVISYIESCEIIKYEHSHGQLVNYYKKQIDDLQCNGEPTYKMIHKPYFIYKSNSGLWCEANIQTEIINCSIECKETRFQFMLNLTGKIIPEAYDTRFRIWDVRNSEAISCVENENYIPDVTAENERPQIQTIIKAPQSLLAQRRQNLTNTRRTFRVLIPMNRKILKNDPSLVQPQPQLPKEDPSLLLQQLTPNQFLNGASNVFPENTQQKNQTTSVQDQEALNNKTQTVVDFLNRRPGQNIQVKSLNLNNPNNNATSFVNRFERKNFVANKKVQILRSRLQQQQKALQQSKILNDEVVQPTTPPPLKFMSKTTTKPCPMLELQVYDHSRLGLKQNIPLLDGVDCKGTPVYKSSFGSYIYRNIYGDWCHDHLDQFKPEVNCMQQCSQKRLHPSGMRSPVDTNAVEIYNHPYESKFIKNYRYACAGVMSCLQSGCQNNGSCLYSYSQFTRKAEYKCVCPPGFTGVACENILNICTESLCLNNGNCYMDEVSSVPRCQCPPGITGVRCETIENICLIKNPCLNDGECTPKENQMYECKCPEQYDGPICARLSMKICKQKKGKIIAHPREKSSFISCLDNGDYKIQKCPTGLVYDVKLKRCDYEIEEIVNDTGKCSTTPCGNNSKCIETNDEAGFKCECSDGFGGDLCEECVDAEVCGNDNL